LREKEKGPEEKKKEREALSLAVQRGKTKRQGEKKNPGQLSRRRKRGDCRKKKKREK